MLAVFAAGVLAASAASAAEPWEGHHFLSDYGKLQLVPGRDGKDYMYVDPVTERYGHKYTKVMLDEPEVFLSPDSPYKGAKPQDLAAISGLVRNAAATALKQRGYALVDEAGSDTLYIRVAVTDVQIVKKHRSLLAYTPVGFVVDTGVKALQDFMGKYDLLDVALEVEFLDSVEQKSLAAAVLQRGKSADARKPISFDALVAVTSELGERCACRVDNSHVPAAQRIDCTDPAARKSRPLVLGRSAE
jgi:hypothetical protein